MKFWTDGTFFAAASAIEMIQQQIQTARVEMRVVPRKKKMAGAVGVAHHIKCQSRSAAGVQLALGDDSRQRPRLVRARHFDRVMFKQDRLAAYASARQSGGNNIGTGRKIRARASQSMIGDSAIRRRSRSMSKP